MELYIDTSNNNDIYLAVRENSLVLFEQTTEAKYRQSERLLASIKKLLDDNGIDIKEIKRIMVKEEGLGFSSLRIAIATANALAYALGIPVCGDNGGEVATNGITIVKPKYNAEPNIGASAIKN